MGIRTDLLVTEEIAESSDLRATPFEFERAKRVEAALSILEGKWKIVVLNRLHILHVDTTFLRRPRINHLQTARTTDFLNIQQTRGLAPAVVPLAISPVIKSSSEAVACFRLSWRPF